MQIYFYILPLIYYVFTVRCGLAIILGLQSYQIAALHTAEPYSILHQAEKKSNKNTRIDAQKIKFQPCMKLKSTRSGSVLVPVAICKHLSSCPHKGR